MLTGRHDTLRADGNSVEGAAFGGPIFYGHAADGHFNEDPKHTSNVWWYQGEQANEIFETLDEHTAAEGPGRQGRARCRPSIRLKGDTPGARAWPSATSIQQKPMVRQLSKT